MENTATLDKVMTTIKNSLTDKNLEVTGSQRLKEDLGLDSLRIVSLIVDIEEELDLAFDESDLDPALILKVEDIIKLVEKTDK